MAGRGAGRARQRGNMVAAVSAIGMAGTLAISAVMNSAVTLEERAIETSLAQTRAYWGAMGQFNYALSRTAYGRACWAAQILCTIAGSANDQTKAGVVQIYLNELSTMGYTTLTYPENSSAYAFTVTTTAAPDDTIPKHASSGFLRMTSAVSAGSGVPAALENASTRLPRYEMRFCMGLNNGNQACGNITSNHGDYTYFYRVRRLTRLAQ